MHIPGSFGCVSKYDWPGLPYYHFTTDSITGPGAWLAGVVAHYNGLHRYTGIYVVFTAFIQLKYIWQQILTTTEENENQLAETRICFLNI